MPCTPTASIYSNSSGTTLANPVTTDGLGNVSFYAAPGLYMLSVSGSGVTSAAPYPVCVGTCGGLLICPLQWGGGAITGTGSFANYFSCTIPAGAVAASKGIRVIAVSQHTQGTATVSYQFTVGGQNAVSTSPSGAANQIERAQMELFINPNSLSGEEAALVYQDSNGGTNKVAVNAFTANFASAVTITAQFNVANTDTVSPLICWAELIQ